jgi:opacity protein-like surface antigen
MKKLLAVLVLLAGPAAAQDGWTVAVSPYVWVPGINTSLDTDFGRLDSSKSNAATLSDLDFAFMGAVEARRGRFGLIGDLIYAKISEDQDTPFGVLFDGVDVTTRVTAATGYGFYRAYEDDHLSVDLLGGARWYDLKIDVDFDEGLLVDVGGFDPENDFTWQVLATVGYQFNDTWSAQAGWRYLDIEKEIADEPVQVELDGPIVGFTYRF